MNMKCNSRTLSLLLLLALSLSGYKWWSFHKKEQSNSQFDYFRLVFIWPNSYCSVPNMGKCIPPVPDKEFTLHGFWPQKDNGDPLENCSNTTMPDDTLDELKSRLVKTWPNLRAMNWKESKELYKEQWSKHGTCSESKLNQKEYLETALGLAEGYDLYTILKNNKPVSIVPDPTKLYPTDDIWNAVNNRVKKWPDVKCNTRTIKRVTEYQLYEIHLCFRYVEVDGKEQLVKIDCDGVVLCQQEKEVYYPNTYSTALSDVPSEEDLVSELEEKAEL